MPVQLKDGIERHSSMQCSAWPPSGPTLKTPAHSLAENCKEEGRGQRRTTWRGGGLDTAQLCMRCASTGETATHRDQSTERSELHSCAASHQAGADLQLMRRNQPMLVLHTARQLGSRLTHDAAQTATRDRALACLGGCKAEGTRQAPARRWVSHTLLKMPRLTHSGHKKALQYAVRRTESK